VRTPGQKCNTKSICGAYQNSAYIFRQTAEFFSHRHIRAENIIQANLTNAAAVFLLIQIPWVRSGDSRRIGFALFTIGELISNCSLTYQYYAHRKLLKKPCPPTFCRWDFFVVSFSPPRAEETTTLFTESIWCAPLDLLVFLQAIELTEQTFFAAETNGGGTYFNEFDLHLFWISLSAPVTRRANVILYPAAIQFFDCPKTIWSYKLYFHTKLSQELTINILGVPGAQ
jgi:hypothetical protein